jgi:DnaK suppressor protein
MTLPYNEIEQFRRKLEAKRADLAVHRDAEGITIERAADAMDQLVLANERDLIVEKLNREANVFRQIANAMDRITTGEYGVCLECGEPISARRLTALPWAALCLFCQEVADCELGEQAKARRSSMLKAA